MTTPIRRPRAGTLALLAFAQLIIALDVNIVFVALPEIGADLDFSDQTLQWVVSAYAVAFGGFLVLGGRCADVLGRRRMFVAALLLYATSSMVGGLAQSPEVLVGVRAIQGLGGALLFPATLSLVNTMFAEGRERNRALAVWSGAGASGLCVGSLLGGVLTGALGWEAVFYVNTPLAGGAALLALTLIPRDDAVERQRTFDMPGAIAATAGATALVFALVQGPQSGWTSPTILLSGGAAIALLVAFGAIEAKGRDPLMPPQLWRNRSLGSAMGITFIFGATFMAVPYFLTTYFQILHGYTAIETGLAFLFPAVLIGIGTQLGARMATQAGIPLTLLTGMTLGVIGTVQLAIAVAADGPYLEVMPGLTLYGIGQGITWTAMWIAAASGVDPKEQGVASGMASTTFQIGTATGLAGLVAVANAGAGAMTSDDIQVTMYIAAGGLVLGALAALGFAHLTRAGLAAPRVAATD